MIDLMLKIDGKNRLMEVLHIGKFKEWLKDSLLSDRIGQNIDIALGTKIDSSGGMVEIDSKIFKYQFVSEKEGATILLSRDGVLLDLYEQTIGHVSEGIQIYDKNGYFLYANPASEDLENFKQNEFKEKHILDIYDLKEEYSTVLSVIRTQKPVINRCDRFQMKNGKALTTINSGYPLKINGNLYGAVAFESDLSVLKQIKNRSSKLESYVEDSQNEGSEELYNFNDIIHSSEEMKNIIHFAKKVSLTDSSILIEGATGTGKELIAQSIHSFSPRRNKPFIDVNCSAIPINLFESMFFGTDKGAFTGSLSKKGFFEMADGGTIFLDEVNSICMEMQAKLLRVLQEKRFQRIGGTQYINCNVRVIAALNENPAELIKHQKMRSDFYYRISTIKIDIPPISERKADIPILAQHFLNALCKKYGRAEMRISDKVLDCFNKYEWPGNVRELQNIIEYGFSSAHEDSEFLELRYLPDYIRSTERTNHRTGNNKKLYSLEKFNENNFQETLLEVEKALITEALDKNHGNITKSAEELGMSRQNLQYRIKKLGILEG